jgi:predicted secreted hydrolase
MMRARTRKLVITAALLLGACDRADEVAPVPTGDASLAPANRLAVLREGEAQQTFEVADAPRTFEFPADHGPHPSFRHEWWYTTGHLEATTGERFGFELTFFRFAMTPRPDPAGASAWRANDIYAAHFAVTDLDREQFHFEERYSRGAAGLAGAKGSPLRVWLEDWAMEAPLVKAHSSAEAAAASARLPWLLTAAAHGYHLRVQAEPLSAPVLNGDAGLSRKSSRPGAASYYYSIPRMALRGQLVRDGRTLDVQGIAWLDREWGSGALAANQAGWDWFALQLDDGSALMFYSLRQRDGTQDAASAGTWVAPDGTVRPLSSADVKIEVLDHWNSPRGGRYPSRWRVRIAQLMLDADVRPLLADQELQTNPRYWEGAAAVTGERAGSAIRGKGYVELVGYADERQQ